MNDEAGCCSLLVVEDDPDDQELIRLALRAAPAALEVIIASDGEQALERLLGGEGPGRIRLVTLDLKLPKVDGLEVLRRIRADPRTRHLPVVVLSSSKEPQDLVRAYDLHANSYVRKPVEFGELEEAIVKVVGYWCRLNQPSPLVGG